VKAATVGSTVGDGLGATDGLNVGSIVVGEAVGFGLGKTVFTLGFKVGAGLGAPEG